METLRQYLEDIHLGVIDNPHTDRREMLTEKVTVCPACRSMHSLRLEGAVVRCEVCEWTTLRASIKRKRSQPAA